MSPELNVKHGPGTECEALPSLHTKEVYDDYNYTIIVFFVT